MSANDPGGRPGLGPRRRKPQRPTADSGRIERVRWVWSRLWSVPASLEGMLFLGVCAVLGLRLTSFGQLVVALPTSVSSSPRPILDLVLGGVFLIESIWLARALLNARTPVDTRIVVIDTAFMSALLASQYVWAASGLSHTTWEAWGFGVSMSTVLLVALGTTRFRYAILGGASLALCYLVAVFDDARAADATMTVVTNALGYFANIFVARFVWTFLKRTARAADRAREREAKARAEMIAARELAEFRRLSERRTFTDFLHDQAFLMQVIAEWDEVAADLTRQQAVRKQARRAAQFSRTWVHGRGQNELTTIGDVLRHAADEFAHLNVSLVTSLVDNIHLGSEALYELESVLRTVLTNVDKHADACRVTVHGGLDEAGTVWEVTVYDDGVGIDEEAHTRGHGWGEQIPAAMARLGGQATYSSPGRGTLVTLTGVMPDLRQHEEIA